MTCNMGHGLQPRLQPADYSLRSMLPGDISVLPSWAKQTKPFWARSLHRCSAPMWRLHWGRSGRPSFLLGSGQQKKWTKKVAQKPATKLVKWSFQVMVVLLALQGKPLILVMQLGTPNLWNSFCRPLDLSGHLGDLGSPPEILTSSIGRKGFLEFPIFCGTLISIWRRALFIRKISEIKWFLSRKRWVIFDPKKTGLETLDPKKNGARCRNTTMTELFASSKCAIIFVSPMRKTLASFGFHPKSDGCFGWHYWILRQ